MVMLRLAIVPYHITNYLLGVTCLQFTHYALGSCAYLYKCILECYIGCQMYMIEKQLREQHKGAGGVGADQKGGISFWVMVQIAIAISLNVLLAIYCKHILDQKLQERKELEEQQKLGIENPRHDFSGSLKDLSDSDSKKLEKRTLLRQTTSRNSNRQAYDPLALSTRRTLRQIQSREGSEKGADEGI